MVLAIGHALRAHEALGRPDALPGLLEVIHRLFEDGVFVGHGQSIRVGDFAPRVNPAPELQSLHTHYERLLRQAEGSQQPLGNRVRQEDKVLEHQGSDHHRHHGLYLFLS
jgi:hypothetical protein